LRIKVIDVRCNKADAAFLLDDGSTTILYDTGFGFTGDAIAQNIRAYLGERNLDYIFLTHSHYDHALGSAYVLRHYPDAKVVAGR
jgi:glyoxylase-like metal-dependent hydrolase (beta-lactamase superfamily II)